MNISPKLLNLDYLVYSSHKTGTQTITSTLNRNGLKCRHCHYLSNLAFNKGDFKNYLDSYLESNGRKLQVISVFRDPLQRHTSSFFQRYGTKPLNLNEVNDKSETIIYQYSTEELLDKFICDLRDRSLVGYYESLYEIFDGLGFNASNLSYKPENLLGIYEAENMKLFISRFDVLFNNFQHTLSLITNKSLVQQNANTSDLKWYSDIYSEFKKSLAIPKDIIFDIYSSKRDLINLFYDDNFDSILSEVTDKYGS